MFISHIQDKLGNSVFAPSQIAQTFKDFYQLLYNIPTADISSSLSASEESKASYSAGTALPTLIEDDITELEEPIYMDEVANAIAATPAGKSPGSDGFTSKFYKNFAPLHTPFLTRVFNSIGRFSIPTTNIRSPYLSHP